MRSWEKERNNGKEKHGTYRTILLGLAIMVGSMGGRVLRGEPFFVGYSMFFAGALSGATGRTVTGKRSEDRCQSLLHEEDGVKGQDGSG